MTDQSTSTMNVPFTLYIAPDWSSMSLSPDGPPLPPLRLIQEYKWSDDAGAPPILIGHRFEIDGDDLPRSHLLDAADQFGAGERLFELPPCMQGLLRPDAFTLAIVKPIQGEPATGFSRANNDAAMAAFDHGHIAVSDGCVSNPTVGATGAGVDARHSAPASAPRLHRPCGDTCGFPSSAICAAGDCRLAFVE